MNQAYLIQLAVSGLAVVVLVGLAGWAKIAKPAAPLDDRRAKAMLAEEFPDQALDGIWVADDGMGAVAKSGGMALVLCPVGDGYAARQIPWAQAVAASFKNGLVSIDLGDVSAPRAIISLASWPPKGLSKDAAA